MRGKHVLMESLIGHGVEHHLRQSRHHREPDPRCAAGLPAAPLRRGAARGRGPRRRELLRADERRAGVVNVHVAPGLGNALGMLYNAFKAALAARGDRRPAGHAPAPARAGARPRPGGDGRAADQVERAGRARRRVRADPAPRAQDRHRPAGGPGVRRPADRRARAGDRRRAVAARAGSTARPSPIRPASRRPPSCCSAAGDPAIVAGDDAGERARPR